MVIGGIAALVQRIVIVELGGENDEGGRTIGERAEEADGRASEREYAHEHDVQLHGLEQHPHERAEEEVVRGDGDRLAEATARRHLLSAHAHEEDAERGEQAHAQVGGDHGEVFGGAAGAAAAARAATRRRRQRRVRAGGGRSGQVGLGCGRCVAVAVAAVAFGHLDEAEAEQSGHNAHDGEGGADDGDDGEREAMMGGKVTHHVAHVHEHGEVGEVRAVAGGVRAIGGGHVAARLRPPLLLVRPVRAQRRRPQTVRLQVLEEHLDRMLVEVDTEIK